MVRIAGWVVGLGLLAAAVTIVVTRRETIDDAWQALREPEPGPIVGLIAAVLFSIVATGVVFRLLLRRFGHVGFGEMTALIAASTLLNVLPLKPGLFGRIAWHRVTNGISPVHSVQTIVEAVAISAAAIGSLVLGLFVAHLSGVEDPTSALIGLAGPTAVVLVAASVRPTRGYALAALVRSADLATWGARYWLVFSLLDLSIGPSVALALAAASTATSLIPIVGNGLGLREWVIAVLAPMLTGVDQTAALIAELVNRAAEMAVILPCGLVSIAILASIRRRRGLADSGVDPAAERATVSPAVRVERERVTPRPDRAP